MGKQKRTHNWQARIQKDVSVDRSEEKKIKLDLGNKTDDGYEEDTNQLVLPSKKRKTVVKEDAKSKKRLLNKKQRKRLEKIVEQKEKKQKRAGLLESLAAIQASHDELKLLTSTADIHSGKKNWNVKLEQTASGDVKINAISGSNKKPKRKVTEKVEKKKVEEESSSESSSEDEEEEEEEEEIEVEDDKVDDVVAQDEVTKQKPFEDDRESRCVKETVKAPKHAMPGKHIPVTHIPLRRKPNIQEQRLKLPILGEEQVIMETINENPVCILCGETGSGKTTQVPQFLYEAGYAHNGGIIGITEPRRVAAISMSHRVAEEMNLSTREVSYQIRYEGNVTDDTKMKFMTDGVLLKAIQRDFLLTSYSVIIIDEAHERSVYTDILIGLLSRIVPLRHKKGNPLKLIIMSATLRVEDFTENRRLFKETPPVIKIDSRQYPVTIHFNKRTPGDDYLGETFKKISKIHRMLPEGGILVFVTGQNEVHSLCRKLKQMFPYVKKTQQEEQEAEATESKSKMNLPKISLDSYSTLPFGDEEADMEKAEEEDEFNEVDDRDSNSEEEEGPEGVSENHQPLYVLPLYSLLSSDKQKKVFKPPPVGSRLCVVATNVAETSLTIPGVKYVIDAGKVKTKFYDKVTGVSTFQITWTSKASANQRAGRAGRTGPGHCYRLYSSAVFNDEFEKFAQPEMTRRPVDDLVLQMKDMNIDKVVNFPFPTPPSQEALLAAERLLTNLGALEPQQKRKKGAKNVPSARITPLGRTMAYFPVSPRYGKMLALGHQHDLLPYVVAIVAALSVQEVFIETMAPPTNDQEKEEFKQKRVFMMNVRKNWAGMGHSLLLGDLMVLLKAVGACEYAGCTPGFCGQHGIRLKAMKEVRKLRAQLTNTVNSVLSNANLVLDPKMTPPSDLQAKLLRQIVLSGLSDHIARRLPDPVSGTSEEKKKKKNAYETMILEDPAFVHPNSVLYKQNAQFVLFQEIVETSRLYMRGVSVVEPEWLPTFAPHHCQFSKPLDDPPPRYDRDIGSVMCNMTACYGRCSWELPVVELEYPTSLEKYKYFAKFLLEGAVFPLLKKFTAVLLSTPATMIKSWAKLQPRTETLLKALAAEGCDSKTHLEKAWKKDPNYLYREYTEWIPQSLHMELKQLWPPL
ncbi:probable ATP-dependent RNA helicase DHX37 [Lineus longissimus]|uniref:probable ATP-dependent RNA helicase DHX37 n=1 Tax=Lineus longissimus TaxID=88925 RepID=UPI002B4C41C2